MTELLNLVHPLWLQIRKEQYENSQQERKKLEELELEKKNELDKRYSGF